MTAVCRGPLVCAAVTVGTSLSVSDLPATAVKLGSARTTVGLRCWARLVKCTGDNQTAVRVGEPTHECTDLVLPTFEMVPGECAKPVDAPAGTARTQEATVIGTTFNTLIAASHSRHLLEIAILGTQSLLAHIEPLGGVRHL